MAYDPEARQTSNSAMIIGIIALVVVAGAVLAYYATQQPKPTDTASTTIINNRSVPVPTTNTVVIAPTVVPTPNTIVVPGKTTTRVERHNTTINRTINRNVPVPSTSSQPSGSSNTTINIAPPANTGSGGGTTSSGISGGGTSGSGSTSNATTGSTDTGSSGANASTTDPATSTENSVANDAANDATSNSATGF